MHSRESEVRLDLKDPCKAGGFWMHPLQNPVLVASFFHGNREEAKVYFGLKGTLRDFDKPGPESGSYPKPNGGESSRLQFFQTHTHTTSSP